MPSAFACLVLDISTSLPSRNTWPLDGEIAPEKILIRVDLPAPLSPSSATTSPRGSLKVTLSRASTPPYILVTLRPSRMMSVSAIRQCLHERRAGRHSTPGRTFSFAFPRGLLGVGLPFDRHGGPHGGEVVVPVALVHQDDAAVRLLGERLLGVVIHDVAHALVPLLPEVLHERAPRLALADGGDDVGGIVDADDPELAQHAHFLGHVHADAHGGSLEPYGGVDVG